MDSSQLSTKLKNLTEQNDLTIIKSDKEQPGARVLQQEKLLKNLTVKNDLTIIKSDKEQPGPSGLQQEKVPTKQQVNTPKVKQPKKTKRKKAELLKLNDLEKKDEIETANLDCPEELSSPKLSISEIACPEQEPHPIECVRAPTEPEELITFPSETEMKEKLITFPSETEMKEKLLTFPTETEMKEKLLTFPSETEMKEKLITFPSETEMKEKVEMTQSPQLSPSSQKDQLKKPTELIPDKLDEDINLEKLDEDMKRLRNEIQIFEEKSHKTLKNNIFREMINLVGILDEFLSKSGQKELPTQNPLELQTLQALRKLTQHLEPSNQQSLQPLTQQPLKPPTQQPLQPLTQQTLQPPTQQTLQPLTQPPLQPSIQQHLQPPTQQPLQPSNKQPLQQLTQPPLEPPTQQPKPFIASQPLQLLTQQPMQLLTQQPMQLLTQQPMQLLIQQPIVLLQSLQPLPQLSVQLLQQLPVQLLTQQPDINLVKKSNIQENMDIKGKVAIVTGAATGIGLEYVINLLKKGAKGVAICDIDVKSGEAASKRLNDEYGAKKTIFIKTDVTNKADLDAAFKKTDDTFGGLNIVINNAGILNDNAWEKQIAINVNAVVYGTLLGFEYMGKHKGHSGGVVVNIASILGLEAIAGCPVYVATKHAVVGLVKAYGMPFHYNKMGVRVVGMCPGVTDTPLISEAHARQGDDEMGIECQRELDALPKQRPSHVANDMMKLIEKGENGALYVSEGGVPAYKVNFLEREQMKAV